MNNKEFISKFASETGMSGQDAQRVASTIVNAMGHLFENGDVVLVPNFGSFEVKKHKERIMTNPSTGQKMLVPPKLVLGFKPASAFKGQIRKGGDE